jgi:tRNA(Ile)-lysidine synthase
MACIDSEVMWILPSDEFAGERERSKGRFSSKFHIDDTTKRVLLIELVDSL